MGINKIKFENEELLKKIVKESYSKKTCLLKLDINPGGGNFKTLDKYIKKFNIDTSHFLGKSFNKGISPTNKKDALEYCYNGSMKSSYSLKLALYRDGYKEKKCENCGIEKWMGGEISLELDHIDGNKYNNQFENLQILCPNCHSVKTSNQEKIIYSDLKNLIRNFDDNFKIPVNEIKYNECKKCGIETKNKSFCSVNCQKEYNRRNIPSKEDLKNSLEKIGKNFVKLGLHYGVSDNSVRKWLNKYNIPL